MIVLKVAAILATVSRAANEQNDLSNPETGGSGIDSWPGRPLGGDVKPVDCSLLPAVVGRASASCHSPIAA